jgi:hypothetical protein
MLQFGRRAPKRAPSLKLGRYLTGIVPAVPGAADYLAALNGGWQMLGNDEAGDCVAVTWANVRRIVTSLLTAHPSYPSLDQVWQVYKTQNPGFDPNGGPATGPGSSCDQGMDIQTLLEWLVSHGGPDGVKACGFASVDHTNPAEVKAAIALFGYVWTGITVQQANMNEFGSGQPWNYVPGSPVDGGHSIVTGGYGPPGAGELGGDEKFITWARETSFTDAFWQHNVEEAWVVIWPEHLGSETFLAGMDMASLAADYQEITGKPFPASVTPPKPAPPEPPAPVPPAPPAPQPPQNLLQELVAKLEELIAWLKSVL